MTDSTNIQSTIVEHIPPRDSYIAGSIQCDGPGRHKLVASAAFQPMEDGSGSFFQAKLMAVKLENLTGEALVVKLRVTRIKADGTEVVNACVTAAVDSTSYTVEGETYHYGAWAFLGTGEQTVEVWVNDKPMDSFVVRSIGNRVRIRPNAQSGQGAEARSGEFNHVYFQDKTVRIVNNTTVSFFANVGNLVDLDNQLEISAGGDEGLTVQNSDTEIIVYNREQTDPKVFQIFNCAGDTAYLVEEIGSDGNPRWAAAPYAIAGAGSDASKQAKLSPRPGAAGTPDFNGWIEGDSGNTESLPHTFTFSNAADTGKQWALHWAHGDDPKVIIKRTDCGGGTISN